MWVTTNRGLDENDAVSRHLALVALVVSAVAVVSAGLTAPAEYDLAAALPFAGLPVVALLGLAVSEGAGDPIVRLREKIEAVAAGVDDVSFSSDREDEIGRLYEAVDGMVETLHEREGRLERHRAYADEMVDAIDDVFFVIDADGSLERWNESLVEAMGYSDDELASMNALDFYDEAGRETIRAAMTEALETGRTRVEAEALTSDGEPVPYEFLASAVEGPDGDPVLAGIGRDVSECERLEAELRTEKRHFRVALENSPMVAFRLDTDLRYTWIANPHPEFRPEEVLGKCDDELLPPAEAEKLLAPKRAVLETGEGRRQEVTYELNGDEVTYDLTVEPLYDESGAIAGLTCSSLDVTDRKKYERELERYETVIQALGDPVYTLDAEGTFQFVNDAVEPLIGYEPAEFVGEHVSTYIGEPELEKAQSLIRELLRDETPYRTFEMTLETRDGRVVEAENHMALLPMPDGEFAGTAGVVRDISERKERERELERTRDTLEQTQRIAEVGGWALDLEGGPPYEGTWTDKFAEILGLSAEETLTHEGGLKFFHPDDRRRVRTAVERAIETGEGYDTEARLVTAAGDERWVRSIGEVVSEDGDPVRLQGSLQDITERKERERELERTRQLLQHTQRIASVGGWELDVRTEPPSTGMTDELYRIHGLEPGTPHDLETAIEFYHPEDRPRIRAAVESGIEAGESYDLELRLQTVQGDERWVRTIGEPVWEDGRVVTLRGALQDVTDQKERELALQSLHETARGLLHAETEPAAAELVVETAAEVLDVSGVGVYLLDPKTTNLEPAATSPGFVERCRGAPSIGPGDDDSLLWSTFVRGAQTVFDDAGVVDHSPLFGPDVEGGLLVPIGDHGVFAFVAPPSSIDDETRRLVETLVATTEAAFDRLGGETSLRERDAELETRNRRLRRQIQINEIIRSVGASLVGATSRDEIERTVCERLVANDDIAFAWIGGLDVGETELVPRRWAGTNQEYLDTVSLSVTAETPEPSVTTALDEVPTVVSNAVDDFQTESWRKTALAADFASCLAVPITFDEYCYGVLTVYAAEPDSFGRLERAVFEELGVNIANSINAVQTREALHADTLLELTLRFDEPDALLTRIAREAACTVVYDGIATQSADETRLFVTTTGAPAADVRAALDDLVTVRNHSLVSEGDDGCLFELTVTGDVIASRLVRHGATPRSIRTTESTLEAVVDVRTTTDVREFVAMLGEQYPSVELAGRRDVERATQTRRELISSLFGALTDRQLEVLRTAFFAGFFEWPRETTGEEVAAMLEVSQPTVNRHLRLGQQRLLAQLFGGEGYTVGGSGGELRST
ncbi:histidine kinase [Natronococcus pandeyae]|uniref:histidine kinase n=1 Tax=Natronococcus pandeyae TaxID=2055836 RepID=A0A8J8Q936_9EURY|nr:PAS domain S-box protein [Natronococcus pandeyae]TYL39555.1 histidine kinase [Natronococcus pandeyae]